MKNNKQEQSFKSITLSELLKIGAKDIELVKDILNQGRPIRLDEKAAEIIKKDLIALPEVAQIKIQNYAKEITKELDNPGYSDVSRMYSYVAGLIDETNSTTLSTLRDEINHSSDVSKQATISVNFGFIIPILFVIGVILIIGVLLWLAMRAVEDAATNGWAKIIIHGPNDPNGPIFSDPDDPLS